MPKYDAELFLTDVKAIFKDNLNTKITALNLEKQNDTAETNDNFDISKVADKAWFFNHIPTVWNYPQFIVWGLNSVELTGQQAGGSIQNVSVFVEIAIPDKGERIKESTIYKLLRYSRALQEIANENYDKLRGYGSLRLESLSPGIVSVEGKSLRMAGINITASFDI